MVLECPSVRTDVQRLLGQCNLVTQGFQCFFKLLLLLAFKTTYKVLNSDCFTIYSMQMFKMKLQEPGLLHFWPMTSPLGIRFQLLYHQFVSICIKVLFKLCFHGNLISAATSVAPVGYWTCTLHFFLKKRKPCTEALNEKLKSWCQSSLLFHKEKCLLVKKCKREF